MRALTKEVDYGDLPDLESNPKLLRTVLVSLRPKSFYEFMGKVKRTKEFHEKRRSLNEKIKKDTGGVSLWSNAEGRKKSKEDSTWLRTYDETYDNASFWFATWEKKKRHLVFEFGLNPSPSSSSSPSSRSEYTNASRSVRKAIFAYDDDDNAIDEDNDCKNGETTLSMDEFFLRCVEVYFNTCSVVSLIKNIGRSLLNDERILTTIRKRGNVPFFDRLATCEFLPNVGMRVPEMRAHPSDGDESMNISTFNLQNVLYVLELVRLKGDASFKETGISSAGIFLEDVDKIICSFLPERFPFKTRLYASAFIETVKTYCAYRCNRKRSLTFVLKPRSTNERDAALAAGGESAPNNISLFYAYDLRHNIVFDNVGLFFKYNVYAFKRNDESAFAKTHCFHDDETEIINACVEFGFDMMETEVLERTISSDLIPNSTSLQKKYSKYASKRMRARSWDDPFVANSDDFRSISLLPAHVKTDADLLTCDGERLELLRTMVEQRRLGKPVFECALEPLLKFHFETVNDGFWNRKNDENGDGEDGFDDATSDPSCLKYLFLKETFLRKLYRRLEIETPSRTDDNGGTENRNSDEGFSSVEELEKFLEKRAPCLRYATITMERNVFDRHSHWLEDEEVYDILNACDEDDENDESRLKFKKMRASDLDAVPIRNQKTYNKGNNDIEDEEPTDVDDVSNESERDESENREEEEEEEEKMDKGKDEAEARERNSLKRGRCVKITLCNVHKDCMLFSDALFSCAER